MELTPAQKPDDLTPDQLVAEANALYVKANEENTNFGGGHERRLLYHLQAQFLLSVAARKRADDEAKLDKEREHRRFLVELFLEVVIIALIGWEIREGRQQANALEHMDNSTAATAAAMAGAAASLKTLSDAQAESLKILQEQQHEHTAEMAKKPRLVAYVGSARIGGASTSFPLREQTDTKIVLDFNLLNEGDASATMVTLRLATREKGVSVQTTEPTREMPQESGSQTRIFVVHIESIRPKARTPITLTFTFPKGQKPFQVVFNADANEVKTATPLGSVLLPPAGTTIHLSTSPPLPNR